MTIQELREKRNTAWNAAKAFLDSHRTEKGTLTADDDAIWGLSHEWGHQHQMQPYFCWSGMGEVSNNIFSYYNTQHMGYKYTRGSWNRVRELFYENKAVTSADGYAVTFKNGKPYSQRRSDMYKFVSGSSSAYNYSAKLRAHAMAEKDSLIYDYSENPGRSLSYFEAVRSALSRRKIS